MFCFETNLRVSHVSSELWKRSCSKCLYFYFIFGVCFHISLCLNLDVVSVIIWNEHVIFKWNTHHIICVLNFICPHVLFHLFHIISRILLAQGSRYRSAVFSVSQCERPLHSECSVWCWSQVEIGTSVTQSSSAPRLSLTCKQVPHPSPHCVLWSSVNPATYPARWKLAAGYSNGTGGVL